MCVLIYHKKADKVSIDLQTGIDLCVVPIHSKKGKNVIDERNVDGYGNFMPCNPICEYNGKAVLCQTYITKSGGFTSTIMVKIPKTFDHFEVFPRTEEINSVLIVNKHDLKLDYKFLDYINNEQHK